LAAKDPVKGIVDAALPARAGEPAGARIVIQVEAFGDASRDLLETRIRSAERIYVGFDVGAKAAMG